MIYPESLRAVAPSGQKNSGARRPHPLRAILTMSSRRLPLLLAPLAALFACAEVTDLSQPDAAPSLYSFACQTDQMALPRYNCSAPPEVVSLEGPSGPFEIFRFEASHPLATPHEAFPCASELVGEDLTYVQAPAVPTQACALAGVRPWHTVSWPQASAACAEIGWRLCRREELLRACQGPTPRAYTYGDQFEGGRCNHYEAWSDPQGEGASEAPSGAFPQCQSPEGIFDANGNLWEWAQDSDLEDRVVYQGAGWRTLAQQHETIHQQCSASTYVMRDYLDTFANTFVGFRCCRDLSQ